MIILSLNNDIYLGIENSEIIKYKAVLKSFHMRRMSKKCIIIKY